MKTQSLIGLLLTVGIYSNAGAQTCSSSSGIDLSRSGGAFASLPARDQGQLGTCYAHSGSDLLSSYLKIGRINIYQTAVANDTSMDGGSPGDVINSFAKLGWACTNTGLFKNLFPSVQTNIIGELQDTFIGTPIFYTINANDKNGIARQVRIAEKAAVIAKNNGTTQGAIGQSDIAIEKYHKINKQIDALEAQIKKLEGEKSWFGKNTEINNQITKIQKQISGLKKQADAQHSIYVSGLEKMHRSNNLDALSEDDAAEVVYFNVNKQYLRFASIMSKYGLKSVTPTLAEFIVDRVHYDQKAAYSYAGIMYPYKLIKKVMYTACPQGERTKIPTTLKASTMDSRKNSAQSMMDKIESILENNRQAVSISFASSFVTGRDGEHHAVNIIGCRTNGHLTEYLLQNSWGQGCSSYKASLQGKCSQGRVWVPAQGLISSSTEINWITTK